MKIGQDGSSPLRFRFAGLLLSTGDEDQRCTFASGFHNTCCNCRVGSAKTEGKTLIIFKNTTSIMRNYGMIFCSVLLMAMVFSPGCITQDTGYPDSTPAPQEVVGNPPVTTPAPAFMDVHLPLAAPTPQVVYVTVAVPVRRRHWIPYRSLPPLQPEPYAPVLNNRLLTSG